MTKADPLSDEDLAYVIAAINATDSLPKHGALRLVATIWDRDKKIKKLLKEQREQPK